MFVNYKNFAFLYLVFYCLWGFVFTQTIFFPRSSLYAAILLLLLLFFLTFIKNNRIRIVACEAKTWFPFIIYTIFGYLFSLNGEYILYRLVIILILLVSSRSTIINIIPIKFMFYSGCFAAFGVFVQFFYPSFYYSNVLPVFVDNSDRMESWMESSYGFAGFTYQLGATASILFLGEGVVLYFFKDMFKTIKFQRVFYLISLALTFFALLLTGKRSFAAMSILIPFAVYAINKKEISKFVLVSLLGIIVLYMSICYFIDNIHLFTDNILFHRFAETVWEIQSGGDASSGRSTLSASALRLFQQNPIFGVGVGNFIKVSHQYTDVHNTYLQVLCEQGIVGLLLMLFPLLICLYKTISLLRMRNKCPISDFLKFSLFLQIYFIMYSFTGNTMVNYDIFFMYYLAISILINIKSFECLNQV